jgi:phage tail-like protein
VKIMTTAMTIAKTSDTRPHFLLDGIAGWRQAYSEHTSFFDGGSTLGLQPLPGSLRPLVDADGSLGGFESAIGVAVDSEDRVYVLDGHACVVKRFDRCMQQFDVLPCIGGCGMNARELSDPHGLAISCSGNLYIADTGNCRVQVFSVRGLALRAIWGPLLVTQSASGISIGPAIPTFQAPITGTECDGVASFPAGTWQPWDIALSARNWAYVSDYANGLIHVFDAHGCWRAAYDGAAPSQPALVKPTRIAIDRDGRIYVIQENTDYVVVLDAAGKFLGKVEKPEEIEGRFCPVAVAVDVNGDLCLSDCLTKKVYFYRPAGDGRWCTFDCSGSTQAFAASMVFDSSGAPVLSDGGQSVCQLEPQAVYQTKGTFYTGPLDSRTYRCLWHRIVLSGRVPLGTAIIADTFTSESVKTIDEVVSLPENRWSTGQHDTDSRCCDWDCLIQSPPGRYLWLRLTLTGDGSATPLLRKIKIYYPRATSLQYLPAVYREDAVSADFLDRFLSIFDTLRGCTSDLVTGIARYFDPKAAPANETNVGGTDFLSWLASWLGMTLESSWPVAKRRELLRQAHRLYALRGTPEGLRLHIELYAGVKPTILELFRLRRWMIVSQSTLGNCSSVFGDDVMRRLHIGSNSQIGKFRLIDFGDPRFDIFNEYASQFLVFVPRWPGANDGDQQMLEQIIEMAKPAHTEAELRWAEPRFRAGVQAFVGVDTVIGEYPAGVIEGMGKLGYDTVLATPEERKMRPSMKLGGHATVGATTVLN